MPNDPMSRIDAEINVKKSQHSTFPIIYPGLWSRVEVSNVSQIEDTYHLNSDLPKHMSKLSVVVSALAKESSFGDYFSGAFKIIFKQIKQDNSKSSNPKPHSDALLKQVNSLREELQLLASNRSVTIITSGGSGSSGKYGMIVVVVVVGYGYLWWKIWCRSEYSVVFQGWKIPDLMFATRRGLTDACSTATKRHLSSRIDRVDSKIDECGDNAAAIKEEVSEFRGEVRTIGDDLQSVHLVVQNLETKISRIEGRQNETNFGLGKLVAVAKNLENRRAMEQIEA
nr:uncharacterized protein LOC109175972 isoform X1 [Ipomoea batatas]